MFLRNYIFQCTSGCFLFCRYTFFSTNTSNNNYIAFSSFSSSEDFAINNPLGNKLSNKFFSLSFVFGKTLLHTIFCYSKTHDHLSFHFQIYTGNIWTFDIYTLNLLILRSTCKTTSKNIENANSVRYKNCHINIKGFWFAVFDEPLL